MKNEREEMVAPTAPKPNRLSQGEQIAVFRYLRDGASDTALADYFNTSVSEIRNAHNLGSQLKWK